jgi:hypothetical protein
MDTPVKPRAIDATVAQAPCAWPLSVSNACMSPTTNLPFDGERTPAALWSIKDGSHHDLPGSAPEEPSGGAGIAADAEPRQYPSPGGCRRAAAVVMPSIFEEQIRYEVSQSEQRVSVGMDTNPEAQSYFPFTAYHTGPRTYLDHVQQARRAVDIPVIASLNGISETVGPTMHGCSRRPAPARWNSILSSSRAT